MATFRVGVGSFSIKTDGSVGIGTESSGHGNLKVKGTIKSDQFDVIESGISTFTRYSGFSANQVEIKDKRTTLSNQNQSAADIVIDNSTLTVGLGSTASINKTGYVCVKHHFSVPTGNTDLRNEVSGYVEGTIRYNTDFQTMEFFNGNEWKQFTYQSDAQNSISNRGRGFYVGGFEPGIGHNEITYFNTSSRGNAVMFGDLSFNQYSTCGGASNQTRGLIQGTAEPSANDQKTEYFTMASEGNGITFGELTVGRGYSSGTASATRSLCAGGYVSPANSNVIDYAEIATIGNHIDFGDLSAIRTMPGATNTPVRSVFINGGSPSSPTGAVIDFVTTASLGNAVDFGSFAIGGNHAASSHANHTRSITAVANGIGAYALDLTSGGNQFVFADLAEPHRDGCFNTGNMVRAVIAGGYTPGYSKNMEEVLISSGGSATDFGDAVFAVSGGSSFSDSHGGLGGY